MRTDIHVLPKTIYSMCLTTIIDKQISYLYYIFIHRDVCLYYTINSTIFTKCSWQHEEAIEYNDCSCNIGNGLDYFGTQSKLNISSYLYKLWWHSSLIPTDACLGYRDLLECVKVWLTRTHDRKSILKCHSSSCLCHMTSSWLTI